MSRSMPDSSRAAGRERLRVVVEGTFDVAAARALQRILCGEAAVVDFSRARDIDDVALAQLATAVGGGGTDVALRGLPVHCERLLKYLGATLGAPSTRRGRGEDPPEDEAFTTGCA